MMGLDELVAMGELTAEEAEEIRREKAAGPPDRPSRAIVASLRAERERMGLKLADVAERIGIDREALHRLEIGLDKNPTVSALERYAAALGKRITMAVEDLAEAR
jgi:DNA-binding XRE family transcriptional regulator